MPLALACHDFYRAGAVDAMFVPLHEVHLVPDVTVLGSGAFGMFLLTSLLGYGTVLIARVGYQRVARQNQGCPFTFKTWVDGPGLRTPPPTIWAKEGRREEANIWRLECHVSPWSGIKGLGSTYSLPHIYAVTQGNHHSELQSS